jgi:histidinol-phosphate phosphatase family protein
MSAVPADAAAQPDPAESALPAYVVVIPTLGRPCLQDCLDALAAADGPLPLQVVLADDRRDTPDPLPVRIPAALAGRTVIVTLEGRGPAAARNAGWRAAGPAEWVAFLDDDVRVGPRWRSELAADLAGQPARVAGVQGLIRVPVPPGRRPTDWERGTAGLAAARWITADMAYRRRALIAAGGFDERFPRAFREDADLALRLLDQGWRLESGQRVTAHPVRPASRWASLKAQAGNADDVLMSRLHGRGWYGRAQAAPGRRRAHLLTTAALATAGLAGVAAVANRVTAGRSAPDRGGPDRGEQRRVLWLTALAAGAGWLASTAEFTAARVRPGPRTRSEVATMVVTSALIPPLAVGHWLRGLARHRRVAPWPPPPAAVLFDRDGTLIRDVPYNGRPELVEPMPGAAAAVARLRAAGVRLGVVTNQSGVGRGLITPAQLKAVNQRVEELLGPFGAWAVCLHDAADGCECRKPAPFLVRQAAAELGVDPADCVVIGDIGSDVAAAYAAGARTVLVPTPVTRPEETEGVPTAAGLADAIAALLDGPPLPSWRGGRP